MVVLSFFLYAQDTVKTSIFTPNTSEIIELDPGDNSEEKVSIASLSETKVNEAPGAVYIVTADEIDRKGYKDLTDVFINIPGFNISTDTQNGTGLSLRGAWTGEAKILWMIDGMIMNDMGYGSFVLSGRIPLLNIERIEIIKGAGSSIYGGIAALGVINIITKSGKRSKGSAFISDFGISQRGRSRNRLTFENTSYLLNDFEVSVCGSIFTGNRSNQKYTQADSVVTNFQDSSSITDVFVEMKLKRKSWEYKILYDDYNFQATHERVTSLVRTFINELTFNKKINKLNVQILSNFKDQIPWNTQYGDPKIFDAQNFKTWRFTLSGLLNYKISPQINALFGSTYYRDHMRFYRSALLLNNGKSNTSFDAFGSFGEISFTSKFANLFAGGRYDYYQSFKPNLSPRLGVTKDFKYFHYKLIYGESFKIPTLQNINISYLSSTRITPEKIRDIQAEFGVKEKSNSLTANIFLTSIQNIIVYGYDLGNKVESYVNNGDLTLRGFELSMNNKIKALEMRTSYSYYQVVNYTSPDYLVDTANLKSGTLSIPKHKIAWYGRYEISKKYALIANYVFQSTKYSNEQVNVNTGEYALVKFQPTHIIDIMFQTKRIVVFTDFTIGVHNLLNTNNFYSYAASSAYPASIGMGRELFFQLKLNL